MILMIQTIHGLSSAEVGTVFTNEHPFGVKYRGVSTCTKSPEEINAFWNAVDIVLNQHGFNNTDFIRAINATDGNILVGSKPPIL